MRLKKLLLKNFRAFKDERPFDFREQVTVIAGVNGHGKTAVLDALSILLSRLLPQVSRAVGGYKPLAPGDIYHGTNAMSMSITANCAGFPVTLSLARDLNDRRARVSGLPRALKNTIRAAYGNDPTREGDAAPIAVYYTTDRAGFKMPNKMPKAVPRGQSAAYYGALWDRRMDYRDLMARLAVSVQLDPARQGENPNFIGRQTVEVMNRVLAVFLEGFNGLRVDDSRFRLVVDKNGIPLDIPQLSDGERSFLAIVTDLCRRLTLANPGLSNPLEGKGVALIDELELHLHPTWQRDVLEKLRATFPGIQFIVTTHSPFIVQTARDGEVIKLDGELAVEPAGRTIEEVARLVMDVRNTNRSPRFQRMLDTARTYLALADEAKQAQIGRRDEIRAQLVEMLAPFSDNPAYTALLERKGMIAMEQEPEQGLEHVEGEVEQEVEEVGAEIEEERKENQDAPD